VRTAWPRHGRSSWPAAACPRRGAADGGSRSRGFGTGLNIAALLDLWRREGPPDGRLHVFSIEGFPLRREEAARALAAWPELADASDALLTAWPEPTPGFHRLDLPGFNAVLDLAVGDATWALEQWTGRADAWFLDGFAPSTNPGMWSDGVLDGIAARSAAGARAATFTVAGAVRRGLVERGFSVAKRPGHGRKRERLEAWLPGRATEVPEPTVAIIGAGIAGASLARAFAALGLRATVVEAEGPGAAASGFPTALVTPRLDAGDPGIAALFAQALGRAGDLYADIPDAIAARGVLQLEQQARDAGRFGKIAAQPAWPEGAMAVVDAGAARERLGEPAGGGLLMAGAMALRPAPVLARWLDGADVLIADVAGLERHGERWRLTDGEGRTLLEADRVVIAAGWGGAGLWPDSPLSPVRGQADWVEGAAVPPVAWGGYAVPTADGFLFGATHDRGEVSTEVRAADSVRNRDAVAARLPALAARIEAAGPGQARAAVRATTPDRLPLAGAAPGLPGLFVLGGLGSRGFCAAPLLADHVAALVVGAPSPLPGDLAGRVDPARLLKRPGLAQPSVPADG
jgi:tRNA 5-methylaminomethyl-2-thiouridine biosynthesis bifunctional protein